MFLFKVKSELSSLFATLFSPDSRQRCFIKTSFQPSGGVEKKKNKTKTRPAKVEKCISSAGLNTYFYIKKAVHCLLDV